MAELTKLIDQIARGDERAADDLFSLVYEELRRIASAKLANEKPGQTLQATALVHEAYIRLVDAASQPNWKSRGHFFTAAAEAMRRLLIEKARRKKRIRHGGHMQRLELDRFELPDVGVAGELLELDEAINRLAQEEPAAAQVVVMRYFAGLTASEVAQALEISVRTVNRHWAYAKAWLARELNRDG
jgi:RNA polymerase sigma factor (TIGR02999 family)